MSDSQPLGQAAATLRLVHTLIAAGEVVALVHVWSCALRRRRSRLLTLSIAALAIEGAALVVGRGDCPLGPLQHRLGDDVPLFELVLPPRAAKAAVPVLAAAALAGIGLALTRRPSEHDMSSAAIALADRCRRESRQGSAGTQAV